ncbi:YgaP family membrane protein [Spirosoma sordidisoli]|jgi:hypothetical protein|uniref:DUF2892 domain-containing protein n=1 Tax=Spirosoma sordidisoli TaxID=2502893 RepID=A0A4Q2USK1_9BACT|nr:DUF2892 domain-containing protein [Spirosoma sordidisoli]RYC72052.1 DUF2892 domain-containing protein [Spirosoma sordidisoli]
METNMGFLDKRIRLSIAAIVVLLIVTQLVTGLWAIVLGIVAVVFALTSMTGVCPLYTVLGLRTNRRKTSSAK